MTSKSQLKGTFSYAEYRFILEKGNYSNSRLALLQSLSIVIKNGMSILGVSTPRIM